MKNNMKRMIVITLLLTALLLGATSAVFSDANFEYAWDSSGAETSGALNYMGQSGIIMMPNCEYQRELSVAIGFDYAHQGHSNMYAPKVTFGLLEGWELGAVFDLAT